MKVAEIRLIHTDVWLPLQPNDKTNDMSLWVTPADLFQLVSCGLSVCLLRYGVATHCDGLCRETLLLCEALQVDRSTLPLTIISKPKNKQ